MSWISGFEALCDHADAGEATTETDRALLQRRWGCPDCGWNWTTSLKFDARVATWQYEYTEPDVIVLVGDGIPF